MAESEQAQKEEDTSSSNSLPEESPPASSPPATATASATKKPEEYMSNDELMRAIGTSPRRIFLSLTSASGIALAANFFGVTSGVLSLVPEGVVEKTGLDSYYPRGEYKRFKGGEYGYTFLYPKQWLGDPAVELAKAQRRTATLDYTMKQQRRPRDSVFPDAAFGPPGKLNAKGVSESDTNVSVVASTVPGFTLRGTLGTPQTAAETLLRVSLAPEGSGRKATLLAACEEQRGLSSVYQFEYSIEREKGVPLRAISVIAGRDENTLITLTVVAPADDWKDEVKDQRLRKVAESFKLTR